MICSVVGSGSINNPRIPDAVAVIKLAGGGTNAKTAVAMSKTPLVIFKGSPEPNLSTDPRIALKTPTPFSIFSVVDMVFICLLHWSK